MQDPWSSTTPPPPPPPPPPAAPTAPGNGAGYPGYPGGPGGPTGPGGPGGPVGPGGPMGPQTPSRSGRKPIIFGAVGAIVVVAVVVAVVLAGGSTKKKASTTTLAPTPTTAASPATTATSPTTAASNASLIDSVPSAFRSDCEASSQSDFLDSSASEQVICSGSDVPTAKGIIYLRYSDSSGSEAYYADTLLQANGMSSGQGSCSTLELSGSATNGSYCETDVSDTSGGPTTGHQFVFYGSSFDVGSGNNVSGVCSDSSGTSATSSGSSGFTVVGWTDDPTDLTAIAVSCTGDVATAKALQNHYLSGDYDLGS